MLDLSKKETKTYHQNMSGIPETRHLTLPIPNPLQESPDFYRAFSMEKWQDYIFLVSLALTITITAKQAINVNVPGALAHSTISATILMGKIYTDEACHKLALKTLNQTLSFEVTSLKNEVEILTALTDQQQNQLSLFNAANTIYEENNQNHKAAIEEIQNMLSLYKKEILKHRETLDIKRKELEMVTTALKKTTQRLETVSENLEITSNQHGAAPHKNRVKN